MTDERACVSTSEWVSEWVRVQGREDASIRAWCCISRFEGRQVNNNEVRSEQLPSTPSVWNQNLLLSREPSRPSDLCSRVTWTRGSGRWKGAEEKQGDKGLILRLGGRLREGEKIRQLHDSPIPPLIKSNPHKLFFFVLHYRLLLTHNKNRHKWCFLPGPKHAWCEKKSS